MDEANTVLADTVAQAKEKFNTRYQTALNKTTDSTTNQKIKTLYHSITTTSSYIDSLRNELNKLDNNDVKNVETIKNIFLNHEIGDSLFKKLNSSLLLAENIAINQTTKSSVKNIGDNMLIQRDLNKFNGQYFSLNGPLGVSWLLSGFESELYKAGTESLQTAK
jgi:hypothetical protein